MPRRFRFELPGVPVHVVQRGNNRQQVFADDEDRERYLRFALRFSRKRSVDIHAYVLMGNHVHLLLGAAQAGAASGFMHDLGSAFVQWYNLKYARTGTLWEGRFRSCLVDSQRYLWNCYRYVEFNPVRAGLCSSPELFPWSSYAANALGAPDPLVTPRPEYLSLSATRQGRCATYREHVARVACEEEHALARLRSASTLGSDEFDKFAQRELGRALEPLPRGRPRKLSEPGSGQLF